MEVKRQVGCSGYKIDLALVDPRQTGRFILGIECDGASYRSSATARDRDRLRQEVLESLGWRIVRIWSTDWMKHPDRQVERVVEAYERQLDSSQTTPAMPPDLVDCPPDEQPVAVGRNGSPPPDIPTTTYQKIGDVPLTVIKNLVLSLLETYGATDQEQLAIPVARRLGFRRTGDQIKKRIDQCVNTLISQKMVLRTEDGSLKLNANNEMKLS